MLGSTFWEKDTHMLRNFMVAGLAFLALVTAPGCGSGSAGGDKPTVVLERSKLDGLDFRRVVQSAKDKVFPAVVYIKVVQEDYTSGRKSSREIAGSGVIISPEGEVLTNWHVVDKAVQVRCLLSDGTPMDATVKGSDKDTDLALLNLKPVADGSAATMPATAPAAPLPYARIGDSKALKEGDFVMAMGAPWGLNRSVSIGIISCCNRYLAGSSEYTLWLQTDASISPGNSGGPLVNTRGEVIGINTLGTYSGDMGFAVPSASFTQVLDQLRQYGKMNWSWTGLQLHPLKNFNKNQYFEGSEGVIVAQTDPESPARRAGIQPRDRIVKINSLPVTAMQSEDLPMIHTRLGLLPKDAAASIEVVRGDKHITLPLTPRQKGKVEGEELDCPRWDFTVKTINQFDNEDLYFYRNKGVFIYGIKDEGNAQGVDLSTQDIIMSIDGKEVTGLDDIKAIHKHCLENIDKKHKVLITVMRQGVVRQVMLDFLRDFQKE